MQLKVTLIVKSRARNAVVKWLKHNCIVLPVVVTFLTPDTII